MPKVSVIIPVYGAENPPDNVTNIFFGQPLWSREIYRTLCSQFV